MAQFHSPGFAEPMKVPFVAAGESCECFQNPQSWCSVSQFTEARMIDMQEQAVRLAHARLANEHAQLIQQSAMLHLNPTGIPQNWWTQEPHLRPQNPHIQSPSGTSAVRISQQQPMRQYYCGAVEVSPSPVPSVNSEVSTTPGPSSRTASASPSPRECGPNCRDRTTLILRNLPMRYSRDHLLELLDQEGFFGLYDLVYHPIDFGTRLGFGYAFVNFKDVEAAARCNDHFSGFTTWNMANKKVCEVSQSTELQGLEAHVERYRNSPVMHESVPDEFKPAMFLDGKRIPFPAPTKKVSKPRAPRLRRQEMRVAKRVAMDE